MTKGAYPLAANYGDSRGGNALENVPYTGSETMEIPKLSNRNTKTNPASKRLRPGMKNHFEK